jgi:beta-glucosidase-like glycosyl hydrolase
MTLSEKFVLLTSPNVSGWQNVTTSAPRLCIPSYIFNDGPSGIIAGAADSKTQLPVTLSVGASFDRSLAFRYEAIKGEEGRTKGIDLVQGPIVGIARVRQSGRGGEGYGEDPYLSGQMGPTTFSEPGCARRETHEATERARH